MQCLGGICERGKYKEMRTYLANIDWSNLRMYVRMCVHTYTSAYVHACVRACVCMSLSVAEMCVLRR